MIAIGLTTTRRRSIDGAQLLGRAHAPVDVSGSVPAHHLLHLRADDVRVDAHPAHTAELEEREDEIVVARVEVEAELDDRASLLEIGVRLLHRAYSRDLDEQRDRVGLEIQDDAAGML